MTLPETSINEFINQLAASGQLAEPREKSIQRENPLVNKGFFCQNEQTSSNCHHESIVSISPLAAINSITSLGGITSVSPLAAINSITSLGGVTSVSPVAAINSISPLAIMVKNPSPRFASRVDWLQGTFRYDEHACLQILVSKLEELFKDNFEWHLGPYTRGVKFDDSARSISGIILSWVRPMPEREGHGWLSIPGQAMDRLLRDDGEVAYTMLFHLLETGCLMGDTDTNRAIIRRWKPTRIDTAIDDFHKKVRPKYIYEEVAKKGNFSGFRYRPEGNFTDGKPPLSPSFSIDESAKCDDQGVVQYSTTLYFGSTESDKRLYIYDKFLQSEGKIDSVRWEARWADDYARLVFQRLCRCLFDGEGELSYIIAETTLSAIEFIDRKPEVRASRCKRLDFWEEMVAQLGRVKLGIGSVKVFIEKTVDWLIKQVSTTFAILEKLAGFGDFMDAILRLMNLGMTRLRSSHRTMISQAKTDKFDLHKYLDKEINKILINT